MTRWLIPSCSLFYFEKLLYNYGAISLLFIRGKHNMQKETAKTVKKLVSVYYRNYMNEDMAIELNDVSILLHHAYKFGLINYDEFNSTTERLNSIKKT